MTQTNGHVLILVGLVPTGKKNLSKETIMRKELCQDVIDAYEGLSRLEKTIIVYTFGTINTKTHAQGVFAITHKPAEGFALIECSAIQNMQPNDIFTVEKEELSIDRYISMNMLNLTQEEITELNKKYGINRTKEYW